jgi:hypothetical protein
MGSVFLASTNRETHTPARKYSHLVRISFHGSNNYFPSKTEPFKLKSPGEIHICTNVCQMCFFGMMNEHIAISVEKLLISYLVIRTYAQS